MKTKKHCKKCDKIKKISEFARHKNRADKVQVYCKDCMYEHQDSWNKRNREKKYGYFKADKLKNPKKHKKYQKNAHVRKYGIEPKDFERMLKEQKHKCKICGRKSSQKCFFGKYRKYRLLHIDHCHKTGKVRGLLCVRCNLGLGGFKDDPILLKSAIKYLKENGSK